MSIYFGEIEMPSSRGAAPRGNYHHGDAKNALLAAANALLERVGAAGLSLRQVAERARLSRQAPYNHFADKEALLAELVRAGFCRLGTAVNVAANAAGDGALAAVAEAYIGFAQGSPALFRLMFSRELVDLSKFPEAAAAGASAFGQLTAVVARYAAPQRVDELSLAAWSLVHGYSMLCIEANLEPTGRRSERARLFAHIISAEMAVDPKAQSSKLRKMR
jgi:AcrR family transcriptional regulator